MLASLLKIPWVIQESLRTKLKDIINGNSILLPPNLVHLCPDLPKLIIWIYINNLKEDMKVWKLAENIQLSVKVAYNYLTCNNQVNA